MARTQQAATVSGALGASGWLLSEAAAKADDLLLH